MDTKIFNVTIERLLLCGGQTLYMVGWSLLFGTVVGFALALVLALCRKGGLAENRIVYGVVNFYINGVYRYCKDVCVDGIWAAERLSGARQRTCAKLQTEIFKLCRLYKIYGRIRFNNGLRIR